MPTKPPRKPSSRSTSCKHKHAKVDMFAAQRAVDAKDYLVTEQGIDASRISVATGTTDGQTAEDYLVPAGATFSTDVTGTTPVDETAVKPQARKPLPQRHGRRRRPGHCTPGPAVAHDGEPLLGKGGIAESMRILPTSLQPICLEADRVHKLRSASSLLRSCFVYSSYRRREGVFCLDEPLARSSQ